MHAWVCLVMAVVAVAACGDRPIGESTTESSSGGGDGPTMVTTGVPGTTVDETSTGTTNTTGCVETTGTEEPDPVVCPEECSLEAAVCELRIGEFLDCGRVELGDPDAAWHAAHDCALAAVDERRTFVMIAERFTFDSESFIAYVGRAGCPYGFTVVIFDDDPCGGEGCGPAVLAGPCAGLTARTDCSVAGEPVCFQCEEAGDIELVCAPNSN